MYYVYFIINCPFQNFPSFNIFPFQIRFILSLNCLYFLFNHFFFIINKTFNWKTRFYSWLSAFMLPNNLLRCLLMRYLRIIAYVLYIHIPLESEELTYYYYVVILKCCWKAFMRNCMAYLPPSISTGAGHGGDVKVLSITFRFTSLLKKERRKKKNLLTCCHK